MTSLPSSPDIFSQISGTGYLVVFLVVATLTPISIVVFAALAYVGSPPPRAAIVLRCIFALLLWFIVTLALILTVLMLALGAPAPPQDVTFERWLWAFLAGYLVICGLLIWWSSWKRRTGSDSPQR